MWGLRALQKYNPSTLQNRKTYRDCVLCSCCMVRAHVCCTWALVMQGWVLSGCTIQNTNPVHKLSTALQCAGANLGAKFAPK